MDTDIKKDDDLKSDPKGNEIIRTLITFLTSLHTWYFESVSIVYNFLFYLENEKDEKTNPTNEETKKDSGANP